MSAAQIYRSMELHCLSAATRISVLLKTHTSTASSLLNRSAQIHVSRTSAQRMACADQALSCALRLKCVHLDTINAQMALV